MTQPASLTHHYAEIGEVMLHYVTAGQGPPVVLIHGCRLGMNGGTLSRHWRRSTPSSRLTCAGWATAFGRSAATTSGGSATTSGASSARNSVISASYWSVTTGAANGLCHRLAAPRSGGKTRHRRCGNPRRWRRLQSGRAALAPPVPHYARPARGTNPGPRAHLSAMVLSDVRLRTPISTSLPAPTVAFRLRKKTSCQLLRIVWSSSSEMLPFKPRSSRSFALPGS